jgi:hypothetical protein
MGSDPFMALLGLRMALIAYPVVALSRVSSWHCFPVVLRMLSNSCFIVITIMLLFSHDVVPSSCTWKRTCHTLCVMSCAWHHCTWTCVNYCSVVALAASVGLQAFLDDVHQRLRAAPNAFMGML